MSNFTTDIKSSKWDNVSTIKEELISTIDEKNFVTEEEIASYGDEEINLGEYSQTYLKENKDNLPPFAMQQNTVLATSKRDKPPLSMRIESLLRCIFMVLILIGIYKILTFLNIL